MPRNSSGVYVLPTGNPVVSDTLIETNWANPTLSDIAQALTDSLDRNGRGAMLAPMKFADGTVGAPSIAFASEASSGVYRPTSKAVGVSVFGTERARFTDQGVTLSGIVTASTANIGTLTVTGDTTLAGLTATGATISGNASVSGTATVGTLNATTAAISGALSAATLHATGAGIFDAAISALSLRLADGAAAAPAFAFINDTGTGLFRPGANLISLAVAGAEWWRFSAGITTCFGTQIIAPAASNADLQISAPAGKDAFLQIAGNGGTPGVASLDIYQNAAGGAYINQRLNSPLSFYVNAAERFRISPDGTPIFYTNFILEQGTDPQLRLDRAAPGGTNGSSVLGSVAAKARWLLQLGDSTAETGTNTGSNFYIHRYADDGSYLGQVLRADRNSGAVVITKLYLTNDYLMWLGDTGGGSRILQFAAGRNITYNTANGDITLAYGSGAATFRQSDNGFLVIGPAYKPGGGAWSDSSDARIKEYIQDYSAGLGQIEQLRPRTYRFKAETGRDPRVTYIGLIAQECMEAMPEMIGISGDLYTLDATALTYALVNAVKELARRVRTLEQA